LDSKSILIYFRIQRKIKGKTKDRQRKGKEYENQIKVRYINGIQN
jgi:hypothetical protein